MEGKTYPTVLIPFKSDVFAFQPGSKTKTIDFFDRRPERTFIKLHNLNVMATIQPPEGHSETYDVQVRGGFKKDQVSTPGSFTTSI